MRHVNPIELKEADPLDVVNKALAELTGSVDERFKALPDIKALLARLDAIEAKANRPAASETKGGEWSAERKAFADYLRMGDRAPELKTLTVSGDPSGGYLAPHEVSSEFIRNLVQYSPIRSLATVRSTTAPSVLYPTRTAVTNATWRGETQAQTGSEPTFGQLEIPT